MAFSILGRTVSFPAGEPELERRVRARWDFPEVLAAPVGGFSIEIESGGAVPREWDRWRWREGRFGLRYRCGEEACWMTQRSCALAVRVDRRGARITVFGDPVDAGYGLNLAVVEAVSASGLVRLHAGVVSRGNRTAAILGPSGRGKSTTVLRSVASGWLPAAEDSCWLEPSTRLVYGTDRALRLWPDALEVLEAVLPGEPPRPTASGKLEVPFERLGVRAPSQGLTDLVLLERPMDSEAAERRESLPAAQAVMALHQACGLRLTRRSQLFTAAVLGSIVDRVRCWRLWLGDGEL